METEFTALQTPLQRGHNFSRDDPLDNCQAKGTPDGGAEARATEGSPAKEENAASPAWRVPGGKWGWENGDVQLGICQIKDVQWAWVLNHIREGTNKRNSKGNIITDVSQKHHNKLQAPRAKCS